MSSDFLENERRREKESLKRKQDNNSGFAPSDSYKTNDSFTRSDSYQTNDSFTRSDPYQTNDSFIKSDSYREHEDTSGTSDTDVPAGDKTKASSSKKKEPLPKGSWICIFSFIGAMIAVIAVFFLLKEGWVTLPALVFIGIGIIVFWGSKPKNKKVNLLISILCFAAASIPLIFLRFSYPEVFKVFSQHTISYQMEFLFGFVGLAMIIGAVKKSISSKQLYPVKVTGTVVWIYHNVRTSTKGTKVTVYSPLYEYTYNGSTYRSSDEVYTNIIIPKMHEQDPLRLDPDDPEKIYDVKRNRANNRFQIIFGAMFLGATILLSVFDLMARLKLFG